VGGQGGGRNPLGEVAALDVTEVVGRLVEGLARFHVPDERQDGVVGGVPRPEERVRVLQGRRIEVGHRPDDGVPVRVLGWEPEPHEVVDGVAVGRVVVALPLLLLDDLALGVEVLLGEGREQVPHPVRLEPQGQVEHAGGDCLEVVRAVEPGGGVARAAGGLDAVEVLAAGHVFGALEHDVFEQVGEARAPGGLVARADVVPEVDGDDGRGVVRAHDDT